MFPFKNTQRILIVRSREVSKSRDRFELLHRFEILTGMSGAQRSYYSKYKSRDFETKNFLQKDVLSDIETGPMLMKSTSHIIGRDLIFNISHKQLGLG